MDFLWSTASKDLRRRLRDPVALLVWIGFPFVILSLLTLAFGIGGNGVKPQAHLLVADEDQTFLSNLLLGVFGQGELEEMVRVEKVEQEEGRERIGAGEGSALLIIPEGFSEDVLNERPVSLVLLTNPAQRILPGIVEEVLSVLVDGTFYLHRVVGEPLKELASGPPDGAKTFSDETIASFSVTVNQLVDRLGDTLFPPVIALETTLEADEDEGLDFGALFFQGMFFMALFFMAQGMSGDVWNERSQGTLRRLLTTPRTVTVFLAGKLSAAGILVGAVSLAAMAAGCWLYGFAPIRLPVAVLWSALAGTVLLALFTLVQLYSSSQRAGSLMNALVMFPLLLVGGSFFPFELMPDFLATIGRWTPNGWALEQLKAILDGRAEAGRMAGAFAGLVVLGGVLFFLSVRRLRRRFALG